MDDEYVGVVDYGSGTVYNCGGSDSDSEASWEPAPEQAADMDDPRWAEMLAADFGLGKQT